MTPMQHVTWGFLGSLGAGALLIAKDLVPLPGLNPCGVAKENRF